MRRNLIPIVRTQKERSISFTDSKSKDNLNMRIKKIGPITSSAPPATDDSKSSEPEVSDSNDVSADVSPEVNVIHNNNRQTVQQAISRNKLQCVNGIKTPNKDRSPNNVVILNKLQSSRTSLALMKKTTPTVQMNQSSNKKNDINSNITNTSKSSNESQRYRITKSGDVKKVTDGESVTDESSSSSIDSHTSTGNDISSPNKSDERFSDVIEDSNQFVVPSPNLKITTSTKSAKEHGHSSMEEAKTTTPKNKDTTIFTPPMAMAKRINTAASKVLPPPAVPKDGISSRSKLIRRASVAANSNIKEFTKTLRRQSIYDSSPPKSEKTQSKIRRSMPVVSHNNSKNTKSDKLNITIDHSKIPLKCVAKKVTASANLPNKLNADRIKKEVIENPGQSLTRKYSTNSYNGKSGNSSEYNNAKYSSNYRSNSNSLLKVNVEKTLQANNSRKRRTKSINEKGSESDYDDDEFKQLMNSYSNSTYSDDEDYVVPKSKIKCESIENNRKSTEEGKVVAKRGRGRPRKIVPAAEEVVVKTEKPKPQRRLTLPANDILHKSHESTPEDDDCVEEIQRNDVIEISDDETTTAYKHGYNNSKPSHFNQAAFNRKMLIARRKSYSEVHNSAVTYNHNKIDFKEVAKRNSIQKRRMTSVENNLLKNTNVDIDNTPFNSTKRKKVDQCNKQEINQPERKCNVQGFRPNKSIDLVKAPQPAYVRIKNSIIKTETFEPEQQSHSRFNKSDVILNNDNQSLKIMNVMSNFNHTEATKSRRKESHVPRLVDDVEFEFPSFTDASTSSNGASISYKSSIIPPQLGSNCSSVGRKSVLIPKTDDNMTFENTQESDDLINDPILQKLIKSVGLARALLAFALNYQGHSFKVLKYAHNYSVFLDKYRQCQFYNKHCTNLNK